MFLGYSSSGRKGYPIKDLIKFIGKKIDSKITLNVGVVGMGNYGKAISTYFKGKRPTLEIVAAFDIDPEKTGKEIAGVECFSMDDMENIIIEKNITIAILTVPPKIADEVTTKLVASGIKGILNFTSVLLNVPKDIYLEEYDMITSIEKVAYYVKNKTGD
jgi:redox-sensing transcriptional repressor